MHQYFLDHHVLLLEGLKGLGTSGVAKGGTCPNLSQGDPPDLPKCDEFFL